MSSVLASFEVDSRIHTKKAKLKKDQWRGVFPPQPGIANALPKPCFFAVRLHHHPPQTSTTVAAVVPIVQAIFPKKKHKGLNALTVRLLESGTGTWTTELLGLAAAVVGDEEGTVELGKGLLQQVLGVLIDEPIY